MTWPHLLKMAPSSKGKELIILVVLGLLYGYLLSVGHFSDPADIFIIIDMLSNIYS